MADLNRSIKIYIDGTEAANGVKTVEAAIQKLEAKLGALNGTEANYATRSKQLQKEIDAKNRTLQTYRQRLEETERVLNNLSGATYNQLLAVQSQVRKQLRDAIPGTQQHTAALEQNRRVTEALTRAQNAMRVEVGCQGTTIGKAVNLFNTYAAVVTATVGAITGATMALNQLREKRNQREEAKADVEALTGLDKDSIAWLEQQAIELSTKMNEAGIRIRQSATEILDAYKLVGSAKPELLNDKEALAEVTEQTLILASASGMKLKDAVDAVTLSMNQYGAQANEASRFTNVMAAGSKYGSAAVESVTSAIKNSGVAAASAGVPIEQLVGTIETLAEKGIKDEIAGTGLKKFFLTLQTGADETNPAIVGLETALDNMQKKQLSATQIKKQFGEEGYNVASVLINEADKVKYYTQAVTGTSVALEQAATKSDTAAAKLDQAKNKMNELGIQLMEKLNPSLVSIAGSTVNWARRVVDLVGFIAKHSGAVFTLTTAIGAYIVVVKLLTLYENKLKDAKIASLIADKATEAFQRIKLASILALSAAKYSLAGNTALASAAMSRFNAVIGKNVIGAVISLVAAAGVAIYQYSKRTKEATTVEEKFSAELIKEQRSLDSLFSALNRSKPGTEERRTLINEINKVYGEYLPNLLTEKSSIDDIRDAYNQVNTALEKQIATKIRNAATDEIITESVNVQAVAIENMRKKLQETLGNSKVSDMAITDIRRVTSEYQKAGASWERAFGQASHSIKVKYLGKKKFNDGFYTEMADYIKNVYEMENKLAKTEAKFRPFFQKPVNELGEVTVTAKDLSKKGTSTNTNNVDDEKAKKLLKEKLDKENVVYAQHQAELKALYLSGNDDTLKTEKQFNARMEQLQLDHQQRIINISGEKSKESVDAQNAINDIQLKQRKEQIQQQIDEEKLLYENQQTDLKALYASGKDENLNSEEAYNEAMQQLAMMHLERMLSIAGLDADQRRSIEKQLLDFKIKCIKDEEKENKNADDRASRSRDAQAKKEQQQYQRRAMQYTQYGQQLGDALGNIISQQEGAMASFGDAMIDIVFDVLTQILNAELIKLTGVGISAAAEVTAKEIGSKGFLGIGTGALLAALVMAGVAAARTGLKGLIGKRKADSSSGAGNDSSKTAQVQVKQWATGRYNVIGQDDGKHYNDVPYIGPAPTGIVRRTSLVSENGAELIINAEDLSRLQRHIDYPVVVQAIQDSRSGRVPQRAEGNYTTIDTPNQRQPTASSDNNTTETNISQLLTELKSLIATLRNLKAYVVLRDLREAEELDRKSKQPFTRSKQ